MRILTGLAAGFVWMSLTTLALCAGLDAPIVGEELVFEEVDGMVAVEAEFSYKQTLTAIRRWYRTSAKEWPEPGRDTDGPHISPLARRGAGCSGQGRDITTALPKGGDRSLFQETASFTLKFLLECRGRFLQYTVVKKEKYA